MLRNNALVELRKKFEKAKKEMDELKYTLEKFQTSSKNLSKLLESQITDKTDLGYGTFMPPKPDLVFHDTLTASETVPNVFNVEPKDESKGEPMPTQKAPSFVQTFEHVKTPRESVKPDCDYYKKQMVQNLVRNHAMRVNHQHSSRMSHPHTNKHVVPTVVLTRSRLVPLNAATPVTTAVPHPTVTSPRLVQHGVNKAHSPIRRPINRSPTPKHRSFHKTVTTINVNQVNAVKGTKGNWVSKKILMQNIDADAAFDDKENESEVHVSLSNSDKPKKHDDKTNKEAKGKILVDLSTGFRNLSDEFEYFTFNSTNRVNAASASVTDVRPNSTNNTNSFNAASPSDNAINMSALKDIVYSDDKEDVGAETDFSNLETSITVSPIPTTRIHKDHPVTQIIGDLTLAPQTRSMERMVKEQGRPNQINDEDFHTCMFTCFLSQEEPKRVHQALKDPSWIEAMQKELLQLKMQKVWVVVVLPKGKRAIGSNWVFQNKKDERRIVIKNKARLVAQGHTQEEGIDYKEVFSPVARIEAIRLFLAYASFMGFMVYQMDVKNDFLYGTIEEEVYVCQPLGFEDPDYPDKVYKVVKALYGLHQAPKAWYETLANYLLENDFQRGKIDQNLFIKKQKGDILLVQVYVDDIIFRSTNKELLKKMDDGIFISQDKYVAKILRMFGLIYGKLSGTPIDTEKPLLKDPDGKEVDVHIYRYLKGKPHLGLRYPKDSPFNLVASSDSDYDGARLYRKSTTGGCQFLGYRLISWQCKKQTVIATSSTESWLVQKQTALGKDESNPLIVGYSRANGCWHIINAVSYELMLFGLTKDVVHLMLLVHKSNSDSFKTRLRFVSRRYCVLPKKTSCVLLQDTRPPMLDRTDFASWQQRIRLYCRGKDNGVNILKSIDEGPYNWEHLGKPLLRAPKEHLSSDNVKMLLEGSELTKEDDFEHFRQHKEESIHDYYARFAKLINDMRNIKMTMSKLQLNSKFINNMLPEWGRYVTAIKLNRGLRDSNYDQLFAYLKQHEAHAKENKMMLERLSQPTAQPTTDPLALL
nr:hypothetical protein [Tanacetum cinerariifolium]